MTAFTGRQVSLEVFYLSRIDMVCLLFAKKTPEYLNKSTQLISKERKKTKIRTRYSQVPHLTQDLLWESAKTQENIIHQRAKRSVLSLVLIIFITRNNLFVIDQFP